MKKPRIAIVTFPGTNGDTENLRTFRRCGFDAFVFRWNDSREKLAEVDGYFIGAGFSYEDRGRSGMVAARDPLFQYLHEEAVRGKVVIGSCNGAQVLVESGLIPLGDGLRMSLARNAIRSGKRLAASGEQEWRSPGFLNEWIFIKRTCAKDRCATSDWDGVMHIPMAHGEGRFVTKDPELIAELEKNDQIAFRFCDEVGNVSDDPSVTLNGSTNAIAGICNPAGNVVALMPHPERSSEGDPYFLSLRRWIEAKKNLKQSMGRGFQYTSILKTAPLRGRRPCDLEIFIDTIIVNNEERTVEQAARRIVPAIRLKQYRYLAPTEKSPEEILTTISLFNPNKEIAYVRMCHAERSPATHPSSPSFDKLSSPLGMTQRGGDEAWFRWSAAKKSLDPTKNPLAGISLIRRDEPDTGGASLGKGSQTGICYVLQGTSEQNLCSRALLEIFGNQHASTLERMAMER